MTVNAAIPGMIDLMYVVLSMVEKHVPYGQLVGTTECIAL